MTTKTTWTTPKIKELDPRFSVCAALVIKRAAPKFGPGDAVKFNKRDRGAFRVEGNMLDAFGRVHVALSAIQDDGRLIPAGCVPQGTLRKVEK